LGQVKNEKCLSELCPLPSSRPNYAVHFATATAITKKCMKREAERKTMKVTIVGIRNKHAELKELLDDWGKL